MTTNLILNQLHVPNYVNCSFPHIIHHLRNKNNDIKLSSLSNLQLIGIPVYSENKSMNQFDVDDNDTILLGYSDYSKQLDITIKESQFESYYSGLNHIKNKIKAKDIVTISATRYYAPYSPDYLQDSYIENFGYAPLSENYFVSNHWVSLYDINDAQVKLYDPIPNNYIGSISLKDFEQMWAGDGNIPQLLKKKDIEKALRFGLLTVEIKEDFTKEKLIYLMKSTLNTITTEFLKGQIINTTEKTYFFGHLSTLSFLSKINELEDLNDKHLIKQIQKCLFDLRKPRNVLRDMISDFVEDQILEANYLESMIFIYKKWDLIYNLYSINLLRKGGDKLIKQKMMDLLKEVYDLEMNFHNQIYEKTHGYLFLKKDGIE